jgi:hypothetical protein
MFQGASFRSEMALKRAPHAFGITEAALLGDGLDR